MSEPNANTVADLNKALIDSNSGSDKNEMAVLMMSSSVNWAEFLTPAPMTIALLGQLMLIAGEKDFSLENQKPEKGFKYIKHPKSFRACLVQVSNTGWRAFNEAHKNMDAIRLYSAQVPDRVQKVVRTLVKGSEEDVRDFLPIELGKIERNSAECLRLAQSVEAEFEHVMDLTGEILEASTAARGYYQKAQEETQVKRNDALAKEKEARENLILAKEQKENLVKGVREAKRSWEKAVDSMPSGWDLLRMEVVERILHGIFDRKATPRAHRGSETGAEQAPTEYREGPVVKGVGEKLQLYTTKLSEDLTSALKGDTGPKEEEPLDKKLQTMKVLMELLQKDQADENDADSTYPEVQLLLKQGFDICKEGEQMASELSFTPLNLRELAKRAADLKGKVVKFCTKIRTKTEANPYTTKPPRQAKTMASCGNSGSTSAAALACEGARVKMAETKNILQLQESHYDKACEKVKETNKEFSKAVERLCELSEEKLADFDQIRNTLREGIKALSSVQKQWQKLVEFFQYITNIIKVCQNESLSSFIDYAKVGQKRALGNGYTSVDFMRDLIYEQVSQANTTSYVVWSISATYVEISRNHLMSRLAGLSELLALDPERDRRTIQLKKTELKEGSREAQKAIEAKVWEDKIHFHEKVTRRIKQIEMELLKVLPPADPARIKEIDENVKAGIKEADDFDPDKF